LKKVESARLSAEAGLKNVQTQIEDQRQLLHVTEINLATKKVLVLELKAKLQKAKDAAQAAKVAAEATEKATFGRGVVETEERLAEQVAEVCRDYCTESWMEALNRAGISADSELRKTENMFFPKHIREIPVEDPISTALPLPPP